MQLDCVAWDAARAHRGSETSPRCRTRPQAMAGSRPGTRSRRAHNAQQGKIPLNRFQIRSSSITGALQRATGGSPQTPLSAQWVLFGNRVRAHSIYQPSFVLRRNASSCNALTTIGVLRLAVHLLSTRSDVSQQHEAALARAARDVSTLPRSASLWRPRNFRLAREPMCLETLILRRRAALRKLEPPLVTSLQQSRLPCHRRQSNWLPRGPHIQRSVKPDHLHHGSARNPATQE